MLLEFVLLPSRWLLYLFVMLRRPSLITQKPGPQQPELLFLNPEDNKQTLAQEAHCFCVRKKLLPLP